MNPAQSQEQAAAERPRRVTTLRLRQMKQAGQPIVCLTAYDALMARLFDEVGVDVILVGDSLGNVFQGHETTLPVTLDEMIYHTKAVVRGVRRALVVTDMPFMSYQVSAEEALRNAGRIMKEGGAGAVKLEGGGEWIAELVLRMTSIGIPVMGHLGLTPQSIHQFGSYRARGTEPREAEQIFQDAQRLQEAGAFAIVLEKIPAELARRITAALSIPTIGIGAGVYCDGQVLVYTDMLGLTMEFRPRFVRRYENLAERIQQAVARYADDVRSRRFPSEEESY
ncbi:3-methyl-2-oxobutanoate hydroxymethyltransferase [bacterium HR21]|jgi:3-methyl-2-oxobutanoate hydroxymethyltransferase|nr:3-methyl-2-oxobutanoate hydroxymethyltransferase [bacterium HR21]